MFLIIAPVAVFCAFVGRKLLDHFPHHLGILIMAILIAFTIYVSSLIFQFHHHLSTFYPHSNVHESNSTVCIPPCNNLRKRPWYNPPQHTPTRTRNNGSILRNRIQPNSTVTFTSIQRSNSQRDDCKSQILRHLHALSTSTLFSLFYM